ncbi:MAG: hypothetical protein COV37_11005 [Bdellovibrio sp. CG11_big_fil_rev_8_21_14_0_20_39_38]|nr:MAG: hypothetical protein COV37_11005 [Bdellovibrio sp. CG11_big_fil_rev_8_21_14_0_20_39_38]
MNRISILLYLISLLTYSSCAFKSDDSVDNSDSTFTSNTSVSSAVDSDYDGIPDYQEDLNKTSNKTFKIPQFYIMENSFGFSINSSGEDEVREDFTNKWIRGYSLSPLAKIYGELAYSSIEQRGELPKIDKSLFTLIQIPEINKATRDLIQSASTEDIINISLSGYVNIEGLKGIYKISSINYELGTIDSSGNFSSLGIGGKLRDKNANPISIENGVNENSGVSYNKYLIHISTANEELKSALTLNGGIVLKITDYEYTTDLGQFVFTLQVSEALKKGYSLFYFNGVDLEPLIVFNSPTILDALLEVDKNLKTNESGDLISLGDHVNNTSFPIKFEEGGNAHLLSGKWYVLSNKNSVRDTFSRNGQYFVGYFKNHLLASAIKRKVKNATSTSDPGADLNISNIPIGSKLELELELYENVPTASTPFAYPTHVHLCSTVKPPRDEPRTSCENFGCDILITRVTSIAEKRSLLTESSSEPLVRKFENIGIYTPSRRGLSPDSSLFSSGEVFQKGNTLFLSLIMTEENVSYFSNSLNFTVVEHTNTYPVRQGLYSSYGCSQYQKTGTSYNWQWTWLNAPPATATSNITSNWNLKNTTRIGF